MSEGLLSVYLRPEGHYLVVSAQTTAGLWLHVAEPPVFLAGGCDPLDLGRQVWNCLTEPQAVIPHPGQDEWAQVRRNSLAPILKSARLRSWRQFTTATSLVDVHRSDDTFTVTPMQPMAKPKGAFEPRIGGTTELMAPSAAALGASIFQAFSPSSTRPQD